MGPSGFEEVVQSEPATEESEGFLSSIFSYFRSAPDKALQDAINTPPSAEIQFQGQQNSDFVKNEETIKVENKEPKSSNAEASTPDPVHFSAEESKNDQGFINSDRLALVGIIAQPWLPII